MIAVAGAAIVCATLPRSSAGLSRSFPSGVVTNTIRAGQQLPDVGPHFMQLVDRAQRLVGDGAGRPRAERACGAENDVESVVGTSGMGTPMRNAGASCAVRKIAAAPDHGTKGGARRVGLPITSSYRRYWYNQLDVSSFAARRMAPCVGNAPRRRSLASRRAGRKHGQLKERHDEESQRHQDARQPQGRVRG